MGNYFFVKSWAIVPRGTSKKRLGTFFKSVLIIFISFSGPVIVFCGLVIDTADLYMLKQFHNCLRVFRFVVKKHPHFLYVTFSYYYETANFFMNPLLYLYQSAMTVSGTRYIY